MEEREVLSFYFVQIRPNPKIVWYPNIKILGRIIKIMISTLTPIIYLAQIKYV
jgi:hypothetical protein